jgi:hypothetical protein
VAARSGTAEAIEHPKTKSSTYSRIFISRFHFFSLVSSNFQSIAALVVVALTVTWLIARMVAKRRKPGCGGDCGCPTQELKR